ncbi:MAG: amidohydrolase family protein [Pseudomonadales bacterium]|nr:amidohydrolase family protein [Pseudomonadales bacterium]
MYDIIIRGGSLVDGTGAEPVPGDLAIKDGVIAAMGQVDGEAKEVIDATGQMVTPGFIDTHTHLDAQIGWDPDMTPVSWHGVTTALIGNCGVTFAPCKPQDREFLASMMETVEDIPREAIMSGLPWDWEQYGEYLNSISEKPTAINVAGLVGHSAIRYYVMGDRSFADQASDEEKEQMAEIVAKSLESGAFGFSTNRFEPHKAPDGRSIPGTFADPEELAVISKAVAQRNGLMQAVGATQDVMEAIADAGSRLLFSFGTKAEPGAGAKSAQWLEEFSEGRDVTAITHVRSSGLLFGLSTRFMIRGKAWKQLNEADFAQRLELIEDADFCAELVAEAEASEASKLIGEQYYLGADEKPNYTEKRSVKEMAEEAGEHWAETLLRLSRETQGRALFNWHMFQKDMDELKDLLTKSSHIYPGLGDAGAHVSQIMDAGWSTFILSYWHRETGTFSIEQAVEKMTSGPAKVLGLSDRGVLSVGMKADVNVFDADEVCELQPTLVHDFPNGAPRFIQKSRGFKATIVNGVVSVRNGELTGTRAGEVLRHGQS